MPKADQLNTTNRRAFLSTIAAAVPAVVAGAPIAAEATPADPRAAGLSDWSGAVDRFVNMVLMVNFVEIGENDQHVEYAVRVPREARLDDDILLAFHDDDTFGADLAAWLAARGRA